MKKHQIKERKGFYLPENTQIKYIRGLNHAHQAWQNVQEFAYTGKIMSKSQWRVTFTLQWRQILQEKSDEPFQHICVAFQVSSKYYKFQMEPPMFVMIHRIQFTHLQILKLFNSNLMNVQFLVFLNMENLRKVRLENNLISNFKVLSKLKWKNLQSIWIGEDKSSQIALNRMEMNKNLTTLKLREYIGPNFKGRNQLKSWYLPNIIKIKGSSISRIVIDSITMKRQKQERREEKMVKNRFLCENLQEN